MPDDPNHPREYDAVLGGQAPPPVGGLVLGGLQGVKRRFESNIVEARIAALSDALKYGEAGLDLVIVALTDSHRQVQRSAYSLLRERKDPKVRQALRQYKTCNYSLYSIQRVITFANRTVEAFDTKIGITDPVGIAYALRCELYEDEEVIADKLERLLQDPQASKIEALVFGLWDEEADCDSSLLVDALVAAKDQLKSLKALFIGDIELSEWMISDILQSDISPVLKAYPNLEVLRIRGGKGLAFSPLSHDKLKALIVETGRLSRETIAQIGALQLPVLEHLELWLGSYRHIGDTYVDVDDLDLVSIFYYKLKSFPNLKYKGLNNLPYSDEFAKTGSQNTSHLAYY